MSLVSLSCLALVLTAAGDEKLEIVNHRPTYGYLGAPRPKTGTLPGDTAHFTFEIKNLKQDENGKASYSIAIEVRDSDGKVLYEQKPYNTVAQNFLGGALLPCSAMVEIPLDAKPGEVAWKISVQDRTTKQTATIAGKGMIRTPEFGIVQVGLFADADTRVPMSAVGVVGNSAYLQFSTVGFGRKKETKQPDLVVSMRILDEQGKPTTKNPITAKIDADIPVDVLRLPVHFGVTFNRAGRFTIELNAEDRVSGKTAQINYGIRVLALE